MKCLKEFDEKQTTPLEGQWAEMTRFGDLFFPKKGVSSWVRSPDGVARFSCVLMPEKMSPEGFC